MKEHKSQCGGSLASDRVMKYVNSGQNVLMIINLRLNYQIWVLWSGKVNTYELTGGKKKKKNKK